VIRTWLTEKFDLTVPVVGAPMAGPGEGRLAGAVSAAGGLGMVGVNANRDADWVAEQARVARGESGRRFGFGLMAWALEDNPAQLDAVVAERPALVSVSFGPFERYVEPLRQAGIPVTTQAGTVDEARRAVDAGVDLVVVRGAEAGGHGRDQVATLPLLQAVLDLVDTPVLAAGGIATARGLAAVLAAGAAGGWVGTALLCCTEAGNSAAARARLRAADETGTGYGRVFDVALGLGWPEEYGGRGLRNTYFDRWHRRLDELAADPAAREELRAAQQADDYDTAYLYAGQGVGQLDRERPAADVLADLAGAEHLLRAGARLVG
jgi:nitronate monooxygenase